MACAHSNLVFYAQSTITVTSGQLCTQYVHICLGVLCPVNRCGYVWAIVHTEQKKREKKNHVGSTGQITQTNAFTSFCIVLSEQQRFYHDSFTVATVLTVVVI